MFDDLSPEDQAIAQKVYDQYISTPRGLISKSDIRRQVRAEIAPRMGIVSTILLWWVITKIVDAIWNALTR